MKLRTVTSRVFLQNGLWFGEDATLRRLPDPLREKCSRPLMLAADELDPHLKTSWTKVHELKEKKCKRKLSRKSRGWGAHWPFVTDRIMLITFLLFQAEITGFDDRFIDRSGWFLI